MSKKSNRDLLGSRPGTIASQVNAVMTETWKTDTQITEDSGVSFRQARARLYAAVAKGLLQRERIVRYRISPIPRSKNVA